MVRIRSSEPKNFRKPFGILVTLIIWQGRKPHEDKKKNTCRNASKRSKIVTISRCFALICSLGNKTDRDARREF